MAMAHRVRFVLSLAGAGILACAGLAAGLALTAGSSGHASPVRDATLTGSSCHGPTGAAYVADPGYQGFTAVDTANCKVIQTYNEDDLQVPGDPGDYNYTGSDPGIALSGTTLWFAVAGTDHVAAINTTSLNPDNYNPPETVIPVGYMPEAIAATPDGSQVWVVDTGPQTSTSPLWNIDIIATSSDKVVGRLNLIGDPTDVAFSPDGHDAYVTTSNGLFVYNVASKRQVAFVPGLGSPESVTVAPDGSNVYVTETQTGKLATISAATYRVVHTTKVGQDPWQAVVSATGRTVYVANPDSDTVSVVDAATGQVQNSYIVAGDPDTLGLTPNGKQLWVAGNDSGILTVINTSNGVTVGQTNVGGYGPNSGDGEDPTGIVLTATPTAIG
jgi:YVTN family beta-propeller protein